MNLCVIELDFFFFFVRGEGEIDNGPKKDFLKFVEKFGH